MMRRALGWVLVCMGCSTAAPVNLSVGTPLAVGGVQPISATTCRPVQLINDRGQCHLATVEALTSSDPSVVDVFSDGGVFFTRGLAVGTVQVHAKIVDQGGDHHDADATIEVRAPDGVDLYWGWPGSCPTDAGVAFPTNGGDAITFAPTGGGRVLSGDFPLDQLLVSDVVAITAPRLVPGQTPHNLVLTAPDAGARGTLSTPLVPAWSLPVVVFELPQATAVTLEPSTSGLRDRHSSGATHTTVAARLIVDGLSVCHDDFKRTVTSLTPSTCLPYLNPIPDAGSLSITGPDLQLASDDPGRCTIEVSVDGTSLTATQDYVVLLPDGGCPDLDGGAGVGPCN